jgi:predicted ester cyclase
MYIELWNTGNFDLLKSVLPLPAYMNSHGHRVVMDQAMLHRVITAWRTSMPDLNFKIEDTIAQGDKLAMRLTLTGSYRAILFPNTANPASNAPPANIHATEMLMFRLQDGKIQEVWEEYDELAMRSQMGGGRRIPEPAAAGSRH